MPPTCDYGPLCDRFVRDRLVIGIKSHEVRKVLLCEKARTLNTALDINIIRAAETTRDQNKKIDGELESTVNAFKNKGRESSYKQKAGVVRECK